MVWGRLGEVGPGLPGLTRVRHSPGRVIAPKKARIVQQRKLKKVSRGGRGAELGGKRGSGAWRQGRLKPGAGQVRG